MVCVQQAATQILATPEVKMVLETVQLSRLDSVCVCVCVCAQNVREREDEDDNRRL